MKTKIIINAAIHETRIAILEDEKMVEIWVERPDNERMVGDIYKGRVNAVIPGIQASFVDIGMEKKITRNLSIIYAAHLESLALRRLGIRYSISDIISLLALHDPANLNSGIDIDFNFSIK